MLHGVRTLLIDNYDSYTHNLYQILAEVNGGENPIGYHEHSHATAAAGCALPDTFLPRLAEPPKVVRNDEVDVEWVMHGIQSGRFHNVVISPGPGTPANAADIGLCLALLRAAPAVPVLGVCLGFQALALTHGGAVSHAAEPVHGRLSGIRHTGHRLFSGIPSGPAYQVVRYHSLVVDETSLPACLEPLAWTCGDHHALGQSFEGPQQAAAAAAAAAAPRGAPPSASGADGVLMALRHRVRPHYGVQYHPESVATGYGPALLQNFRDLTLEHHGLPAMPAAANAAGPPGRCMPPRDWEAEQAEGNLSVQYLELPGILGRIPGGVEGLFIGAVLAGGAGERAALEDTFWLDSSATDRAQFSFMGGRGGPLWRRITYKLPSLEQFAAANGSRSTLTGTLTTTDAAARQNARRTTFWAWLEAEMERWRCRVDPVAAAALPFNFWGGLVGYLGYELKAECGGAAAHQADTPDAALLLVDRLLAVDHATGSVFAVALHDCSSAGAAAEAGSWVAASGDLVRQLAVGADDGGDAAEAAHGNGGAPGAAPEFQLREGRDRYIANVEGCMKVRGWEIGAKPCPMK